MKKIKYRSNNYNNQIYSINYKFDSISPAGKFSGTALDLIKRYNELAKEAHSNGNYVEAEVFRQYAEHYRKIVTEINERKNVRFNKENDNNSNKENCNDCNKDNVNENNNEENTEKENVVAKDDMLKNNSDDNCSNAKAANVSEDKASENKEDEVKNNSLVETKPKINKKSFTVIEVKEKTPKTKRVCKNKPKKDEIVANE